MMPMPLLKSSWKTVVIRVWMIKIQKSVLKWKKGKVG
jgi:hypothetical protein